MLSDKILKPLSLIIILISGGTIIYTLFAPLTEKEPSQLILRLILFFIAIAAYHYFAKLMVRDILGSVKSCLFIMASFTSIYVYFLATESNIDLALHAFAPSFTLLNKGAGLSYALLASLALAYTPFYKASTELSDYLSKLSEDKKHSAPQKQQLTHYAKLSPAFARLFILLSLLSLGRL